jgi:hypothetical protein
MPLAEKQVEEYRKKLRDREYMEKAVSGIAERFSTGCVMAERSCTAELRSVRLEINDTEEKERVKNTLIDLNDHLFERIEWLTDRDVKGAELTEEIKRTEAAIKVSEQIIKNADLIHRAALSVARFGGKIKLPTIIEDKPK